MLPSRDFESPVVWRFEKMKDILLKKDLIAYLIHEIERVKDYSTRK